MSVQLCGCGSGDHGAVSVSGSDPGDRSSQGSGRRGDRYVLYVCRSADEDSGADPGTTGITQEMVEGQPTPAEAVRAFLDFCGEQDLMGHNLIFDYSFLKHQAADQKIPFEKNGIDTLKIARILLPDLESRSLTNLCGYFQIDRRTPTVHITMHWQRMNCISIWCGSQKKDRSGSFSRNSYSIK